jgi:RNA polymerase sigma factor (sigma-70 family)
LYYKSLCYFAKQINDNNQQAEEIVFDAFVKLGQKNTDFNELTEIKLFLFMMVRNGCSKYLGHSPKKEESTNEVAFQKDEHYIESKMIKAGLLQIFLQEIESLPPIRRKIFQMSFLDGLSIFQIAEQLQVTIDTVRVQKAKALHSICCVMLEKKA